MDENVRALVKGSIEHWERMIRWAKKQDIGAKVLPLTMEDEIDDSWYAPYCPLCKMFLDGECEECPLYRRYGRCDDDVFEPEPAWVGVERSETWGDWTKNASVMLTQLKSLLE